MKVKERLTALYLYITVGKIIFFPIYPESKYGHSSNCVGKNNE